MTSPNPTNPTGDNQPNTAGSSHTSKGKHMIKRLSLWFAFCVFISSIQPVFYVLWAVTFNKPLHPFNLFSHGEVPIIALAIVSSSVLDLLNSNKPLEPLSALLLGVSTIIIVISALWFALFGLGVLGFDTKASDTTAFSITTIIWFFLCLIVALLCQILVIAEE